MSDRREYFHEYNRRTYASRRERESALKLRNYWTKWLLRELGVSPVEKRGAIKAEPDPKSAIWPHPALDAELERRILSATGMYIDLTTGCWLTPGDPLKYGGVKVNGSAINASRASWICFRGPVPEGMYVCHSCDNRRCRNPGHLFAASQRENMRDASKKGRAGGGAAAVGAWEDSGERSLNVRRALTDKQVAEIRTAGLPDSYWVKKLGVVQSVIQHARTGYMYAHVNVAPDVRRRKAQGQHE